ncbi:YflJ family protein [Peribacillus sp. SCS-26]
MAYKYSKGWFIQQLKAAGISKHPVERRKLELYRIHVLRNLYAELGNEDR